MCFADGFISYRALRDDFVVRMEGAFGHEKEVTSAPIRRDEEGFNRFTCKLYQRASLPPAKFGGAMYPLRLASGVLEAIPGGAWVYDDTGSARYLNISTLGPLSIYPHKYSRYAGKYLFYHSYGQISETWAFSTDGSLDLLAYPPGPWGRGQAEPVRGGLLFAKGERTSFLGSWICRPLHPLAGCRYDKANLRRSLRSERGARWLYVGGIYRSVESTQ
jgi:hypothetical protein